MQPPIEGGAELEAQQRADIHIDSERVIENAAT